MGQTSGQRSESRGERKERAAAVTMELCTKAALSGNAGETCASFQQPTRQGEATSELLSCISALMPLVTLEDRPTHLSQPLSNCELSEAVFSIPRQMIKWGSQTAAEHPEIPLHSPLSNGETSSFLVEARSFAHRSSHKQQQSKTPPSEGGRSTYTLTPPSSLRKGNTLVAWQPYPQHPALLPGVKDTR